MKKKEKKKGMRSLGDAILAAASSRYSRNGMRAREEVKEEEGD